MQLALVRAAVPWCARPAPSGACDHHFHDLDRRARFLREFSTPFSRSRNFCPFLRALRNLQQRPAVDGRHFDLGAQAGFVDTVTGTVISISSPSRRKNGCGSTRTVMYRSPAGAADAFRHCLCPPPAAANPDCAPGGMRTSTVSGCDNPSVAMAGRADIVRSRPLPSQRGQVRLNFIAPAICVTLPLPLHSGQTVRCRPAAPRAVAGRRRLPGA